MTGTGTAPPGRLNLAGDAVATGEDGAPVLVGRRCEDCGARLFPPVPVCPECLSERLSRLVLSRHGTLYSWSVVHAAPQGWTVPYVAAYVDLPEGVRVFSHIVDADAAALEMDMTVTLRLAVLGEAEDGTPVESYAFAPAGRGGT